MVGSPKNKSQVFKMAWSILRQREELRNKAIENNYIFVLRNIYTQEYMSFKECLKIAWHLFREDKVKNIVTFSDEEQLGIIKFYETNQYTGD